MTRPVYIYQPGRYPRHVAYFGEHAEIMRLAFGLNPDCKWFWRLEK